MKQELESLEGFLVQPMNSKRVAQLERFVAKHQATIARLKRCLMWIVLLCICLFVGWFGVS